MQSFLIIVITLFVQRHIYALSSMAIFTKTIHALHQMK